jgi:hypothetical protein
MSKLLLSRINSSQCGTLLEVLQDMQKLIALLVTVVGVLVSWTAILNSSDHGELQNAAADFQSSAKLKIFSQEFQELLSLLQCNTLKFIDFKMLLGGIIKQRF